MNLDQQLRTDLRNAAEHVPSRHGSLDVVVSAGSRRRNVARFSQMAAAVLVVGAIGMAWASLGRPALSDVAGLDAVSTIRVDGFEVPVDGLLPGFEEDQIYRAGLSPAPAVSTDQYGPEQVLTIAVPSKVGIDAVTEPSVYLGEFAGTSSSVFLYTDNDGLACVWLTQVWCIDSAYTRGGAVQWMIDPVSSDPADGATIVVAWYGLPARASIVAATVDANPVGWQRVTGGTAVLSVSVDLGSDLVLTALDASGSMIDFGRDDAGLLILGEQRFDDLTFQGIGE